MELLLETAEAVESGMQVLVAFPPSMPGQRCFSFGLSGGDLTHILTAQNASQQALLIKIDAGGKLAVRFGFELVGDTFADGLFAPTGGAHEMPSPQLKELVTGLVSTAKTPAERLDTIIRHVESRFTYGRREIGLGDGEEAMPALAEGVHPGTCVDTHSYAVAALRAAGLPAAYVSGIYFPQGENRSEPGHCWIAAQAGNAPSHWDISHFLKYDLGPVLPVANPRPGFRLALSIGRDLIFSYGDQTALLTRLSGFMAFRGPIAGEKIRTSGLLIENRAPAPLALDMNTDPACGSVTRANPPVTRNPLPDQRLS